MCSIWLRQSSIILPIPSYSYSLIQLFVAFFRKFRFVASRDQNHSNFIYSYLSHFVTLHVSLMRMCTSCWLLNEWNEFPQSAAVGGSVSSAWSWSYLKKIHSFWFPISFSQFGLLSHLLSLSSCFFLPFFPLKFIILHLKLILIIHPNLFLSQPLLSSHTPLSPAIPISLLYAMKRSRKWEGKEWEIRIQR